MTKKNFLKWDSFMNLHIKVKGPYKFYNISTDRNYNTSVTIRRQLDNIN